jgi:hypothetical protein
MLLNELQNYTQFHPAKAPGTFERYGFKPDFRDHVLASHVDVRRLAPIQGNKEEPIGTSSENRRHCLLIVSL